MSIFVVCYQKGRGAATLGGIVSDAVLGVFWNRGPGPPVRTLPQSRRQRTSPVLYSLNPGKNH